MQLSTHLAAAATSSGMTSLQRGGGAEVLKAEVLAGRLLQLPSVGASGGVVTAALEVFP